MIETFDIIVIGSGPAGQKAAIQGSKANRKVVVIELERAPGGACVHHGTIPSKTLRETAVAFSGFRRRTGGTFPLPQREDLQLESLMSRLKQVVSAHEQYMTEHLQRNNIDVIHGKARFVAPQLIEVEMAGGGKRQMSAQFIVIASGSRPRTPSDVSVDHEHILDSDSILSITYLPHSLVVMGAGVIASEYASIFSTLGTKVTMVDNSDRPLSFLDPELSERFLRVFEEHQGRFVAKERAKTIEWDGLSEVVTTLGSGEILRSEKVLYALGRVANVAGMGIETAGLRSTSRGYLAVDEHCRTEVPHIYAVGDVIGPPSLASAAMEQGRRAVCHALGLPSGHGSELIPVGVYTIPEISSVGLTEAQAIEKFGGAVVGRAPFHELARGQIAANQEGLLKLVADAKGERLLGVQVIGEGAAELVHVGQMALIANQPIDVFVDQIFNFPTLAEAYRVAAFDIAKQRSRLTAK